MVKKCKNEFIVFNDTDGIVASSNTFKSRKDAETFIKNFRKRFKAQGYYFTSNMLRINPQNVKLRIEKINCEGVL